MSRQEDFIEAGIAYRMEHSKPMCIAGSNLADVERDFNRVIPYEEGAEHGYQYALQHPHWIPVEERLPKFDEQVLVYGLCPNGCRLFYVDCLIQDINDNGYPKWDDDTIIPTHWMEIVPPRKQQD